MNNFKPWPKNKPKNYNPKTSNKPCDMLVGPCCCGAWHKENEFNHINLPIDSIESYLPICPQCHDTKHVYQASGDNTTKLSVFRTFTRRCSKCDISWEEKQTKKEI